MKQFVGVQRIAAARAGGSTCDENVYDTSICLHLCGTHDSPHPLVPRPEWRPVSMWVGDGRSPAVHKPRMSYVSTCVSPRAAPAGRLRVHVGRSSSALGN